MEGQNERKRHAYRVWRSSETIDRLNRLERPGFAVEFLRRNPITAAISRAHSARSRAPPSMPKPPASVSLGDGGCVFAHDPSLPVGPAPVAWLPELSPGTLILEPAPAGFDHLRRLMPRNSDWSSLMTQTTRGVSLLSTTAPANCTSVCRAIIPPHVLPFCCRLTSHLNYGSMSRCALCVVFVANGQTSSRRASAYGFSETAVDRASPRLRRSRHRWWASRRRGGSIDLRSRPASLRRMEDSHARRKANRLIHDSVALVERGYLKLLRGL